jgi:hypothetical protein
MLAAFTYVSIEKQLLLVGVMQIKTHHTFREFPITSMRRYDF